MVSVVHTSARLSVPCHTPASQSNELGRDTNVGAQVRGSWKPRCQCIPPVSGLGYCGVQICVYWRGCRRCMATSAEQVAVLWKHPNLWIRSSWMRAGRELVVCVNVPNSKKGRLLRDTLKAHEDLYGPCRPHCTLASLLVAWV